MITECPRCESKVDCEEKGHIELNDPRGGPPEKVVLLKCAVCGDPLLGVSELVQVADDAWEWEPAQRLWPSPEVELDWGIPAIVRDSLNEAKLCYKAKAYSACAVMCGRAIEGVSKHHDPSTRSLAAGLDKLRKDGIIDDRIHAWATALRENRNLGAHATTDKVSKSDARDLLDFSIAICEYVFVLKAKFDEFQERQKRKSGRRERQQSRRG